MGEGEDIPTATMDAEPEKNASGPAITKQVVVKVFHPKTKRRKFQKIVFKSAKGKGFTREGVDRLLARVAFDACKAYPEHQFKEVPLGKHQYNFVPSE